MAKSSAFDVLYQVSDLPPLIFGWLDPSSLALAACVCRAWRNLARACNAKARGESKNRFQLVFVDLLASAPTLAWTVKNLNEKKLPSRLRDRACLLAARGGNLESLQLVRADGCRWNEETCALAAEGGHLAVLQWAHENGCEWNEYTCALAAQGGHLDVLKWARQNGCEWDGWTCAFAAQGAHLAVLQWAREHGCEWNEYTCAWAAQGGHLAVLQWARANGYPWDQEECRKRAVYNGHKELVAWIDSQSE